MEASGGPTFAQSHSTSASEAQAGGGAGAHVLRFAPSPNGYLHLGHAYSALANERAARRLGGRLLLRLENIDAERCRPEFESALRDDLAWLGVRFEPDPRRQDEHFSVYRAALMTLLERGVLYPCFCTRGEIARAAAGRRDWPRDPDGSPHYPGTCKRLSAAQRLALAATHPAALRLDMEKALDLAGRGLTWREFGEGDEAEIRVAKPERWGDAVLARRDIPASYHIAAVVDDELQGVTDVVRGLDLFEATSLHRLIQRLLGYRAPDYRHHKILCDEIGTKLSKRNKAKSIRAFRAQGATAAELRRQLGF